MREKYKLKLTSVASDDLDQIYDYIATELSADKAADTLIDKIEKSMMRLCEYPYSNVQITDGLLKVKGYHKMPIDNYLVFYVVNEAEKMVIVMRVIYGARQYEGLV